MTTEKQQPTMPVRYGDAELLARTYAGGTAYVTWEKALDGVTAEQATTRPEGCPHSVADVVAHAHFWQRWMLDAAGGNAQPWPEQAGLGWPEVNADGWEALKRDFMADAARAQELARDEAFTGRPSFRHDTWGKTLLSFSFHNAYHLGQVVLIRRMVGAWPPPGGGDTW